MRKDKLYFLTFLSITIIYSIVASLAFNYLVKESTLKLLETHLVFSKKEAKSFSTLLSHQLSQNISKDSLIHNIQKSLNGTDFEMGFLSIYDWSGKVVAHPDIKNVGLLASPNNSYVSSVNDDLTPKAFYDFLNAKNEASNTGTIEKQSKVVVLNSIQNSDWILAAHVRTDNIRSQIQDFKSQFLTVFLVMGLFIVIAAVVILRIFGSSYEKTLELKNEKLEDEVINLSKLNRAVGEYQQKVSKETTNTETESNTSKKRLLTYVRNELVPVPTNDIAYIYTENTITYVVCNDKKRSTSNLSLDELSTQLDESFFFRANRQFIISIASIEKIVKYGNNQLKILVTPDSESSIIISKNKAAQFKQWLNI
ncbi:LytR/AlgR family response regulator transcription factor [Hyunsoonleella pacifica]|uniref:LytTR family transcriptional regulator n=1 Tax=Hyunsoonleella pacifica TaxID=1080224 RepID=A0A4Q9FS17_9FLAO|nr:LytTR family DNA-binding domain-containing protein [Hyunsoonleella pacifica]TBN18854.1 LytTR family transcriptional regulator [Hyunsoonleella pacifica]GGD05356.1 hypothetical protein GCM10011368_03920 [Hyunsoonleella pacifica]